MALQKEIIMNNKAKLATLKMRAKKIRARGKYLQSPGVLKKVLRQIKTLEEAQNV